MKENFEALIASIGCTLLLAVGLFFVGVAVGHATASPLLAPPRWLLVLALLLLSICSTLFLRAYKIQQQAAQWLDIWPRAGRRSKIVGYKTRRSPETIEEAWLRSHIDKTARPTRLSRVLDSTSVWGWATVLSFLTVAYSCIWLGLSAVGNS